MKRGKNGTTDQTTADQTGITYLSMGVDMDGLMAMARDGGLSDAQRAAFAAQGITLPEADDSLIIPAIPTDTSIHGANLDKLAAMVGIVTTESASIINPSLTEGVESMKRFITIADQTTAAPVAPVLPPSAIVNPVVARKDSQKGKAPIVRNSHDRDVAYFDKVIAKNKNIARLVMPEYSACPVSWTPSIKRKAGESVADHISRDYNGWLKSYARALLDGKVKKVDGVLFFPAKITAGGYLTLIREGKQSYALAYAAKAMDIFAAGETDKETATRKAITAIVGLTGLYPVVAECLSDARAYHKAANAKDPIMDDVDSAYNRFVASFKKAHNALRAVDTGDSDMSLADETLA